MEDGAAGGVEDIAETAKVISWRSVIENSIVGTSMRSLLLNVWRKKGMAFSGQHEQGRYIMVQFRGIASLSN